MNKEYLFIIGINDYKHCPPLYSPIKSVRDLIETLSNKFGYNSSNILSLTNVEATKDDILKSLEKISKLLTDADNLILFFSGHSYFDQIRSEGYWIPYDGNYEQRVSMISNYEILEFIESIRAKNIFIISDAIFSSKYIERKRIPSNEENKSRWVISAGINEIVSDGAPGMNSPFFETINYRLNNIDDNIKVSELIDFVIESVPVFASQPAFGGRIKDLDEGGNYTLKIIERPNNKNRINFKELKLEIAKGNTEMVLEQLIELNNSFSDYIILLNSRWKNLKREVLGGTIEKRIADIESNQITKSILELMNEIEKEEKNAS